MIWYKEFVAHEPELVGKRKKVDNTIYTFDIETSNYIILNDKILPAIEHDKLTEDEQKEAQFRSFMYIWQFGINDTIYYGRTWEQLKAFLIRLDYYNPERKILFIHNLSFEFQYLKSVFAFSEVTARKKHKVMKCQMRDFNIEMHCTYFMSNAALAQLPKLFKLPVEKKTGDLDYDLIRTPETEMTEKELGYCEYDCLVVYHYIKRMLETYERVDKIPITSTRTSKARIKRASTEGLGVQKQSKKSSKCKSAYIQFITRCICRRIYARKLDMGGRYCKTCRELGFYELVSVRISNA